MVGRAEQPPVAEQRVVDGPRVDADRDQVGLVAHGGGEPRGDRPPEAEDVPVQADPTRASSAPALGHGDRVVREPGDVPQPDAVAVGPAEHDPAARRAEVDGRDRPAHRRKAAATPASTGMCSPVVCEKSLVQMA
nr:hypothetical protein GCM10025699_63420 [Microbacterium flavescens]